VTKKKTPGASGGENEASEVERFLLAGPTDRVLHGEILPPKGKGSRAVAAPRQTGRAISTDIQAKDARPGIHKISKSTGFYLKVSESGSASYFWRYRFAGKRREIGLGSRKDVSLSEARADASEQAALRRRNIDPVEQRRRERAEEAAKVRAAKPVTFREMTERFVADNAGSWRHKYARTCWLSPVIKYAYPTIGHLGVDDIEIGHVTAAIKATAAAGVPKTGARVRAKIEQVLNAAIGAGHRSASKLNPADVKLHAKRKIKRVPFRAVDLEDAPSIYRELKARSSTSARFSAWVFMILTASRPSEALNAKWSEVHGDKKLWVVSPDRMKSGCAHEVPLSQAALEVLDQQKAMKTGDAIFPGRGGSPVSYASFFDAPKEVGIAAATAHGWRSVFRDWCGDIGDIERDLAEAALAHSLASVEASYRRRTAVERRRKVMEDYSRWLSGDGVGQVIAFPNRKATR
jgi:integrase